MDKLVVSSDEVASIATTLPVDLAAPRLPSPLRWPPRILLAPLTLVLPALCLATIVVWLVTRRKEPRLRHAWMQYCCALLVVSGLVSSTLAGLAFFMIVAPAPQPAAPFVLDTLVELPGTVSAVPLTARELASRVEEAVFIVTRDSKWLKPTREALAVSGFGTAVLLFAGKTDFLLATSRHVLDGEKWQRASPYAGDAVLWDRHGGFTRAQIVGRHKELDLMVLRMPRTAGISAFTQQVLAFEQVAPGERIMVFGHPEGLFFSLSDGLVSRKEPGGRIQITAPVSPGASGGPVYDLRGRLLGIVSGMMDKRHSPLSENLNFAVRADSLLHPEQWNIEPAGKAALEEYVVAAAISATEPADSPSPHP